MVKINYLPVQFRKKIIKERIQKICQENDVAFMALFGSYLKGEQTKRSDVDILIEFDKSKEKSLLDLIHTENEMKKIFKKRVDLVTVDSLSPYLKENILKSLKVIYERG